MEFKKKYLPYRIVQIGLYRSPLCQMLFHCFKNNRNIYTSMRKFNAAEGSKKEKPRTINCSIIIQVPQYTPRHACNFWHATRSYIHIIYTTIITYHHCMCTSRVYKYYCIQAFCIVYICTVGTDIM